MSKHLVVPKEFDDEELRRLEELSRQASERDCSTRTLDIYTSCVPASGNLPGDYVGIVRNGNDVCIALADGMGKGSRALYHAQTVTAEFFVRAYMRGEEQALDEISKRFAEASRLSMFFSAFMLMHVTEEKDAHRITIYRMGQPAPLIYRAGLRKIEEVAAPDGIAVGIPIHDNGEKPYAIHSTYLRSDDVLLGFSDGVTEARDAEEIMFSEASYGIKESFLKRVRGRPRKDIGEIVHEIIEDIADHCGIDHEEWDTKWQDDITLAVVRVKKND